VNYRRTIKEMRSFVLHVPVPDNQRPERISAWRSDPGPLSFVFVTVMVAARVLCTLAMVAQTNVIRIRTIRVFIGNLVFLVLGLFETILLFIASRSPVSSENSGSRYKEILKVATRPLRLKRTPDNISKRRQRRVKDVTEISRRTTTASGRRTELDLQRNPVKTVTGSKGIHGTRSHHSRTP
jgi:hypothetical protein